MTIKGAKKYCGIWNENLEASLVTMEKRDYQQKAVELVEYGDRFLAVCGASRVGKSWILSAYANDLIELHFNSENFEAWMDDDIKKRLRTVVQYMTFFEFELKLRTAQTQGTMYELYEQMLLPRVLIIDEYGRGKWSDFTATFFQNVLIKRYGEKKKTIIGSNLLQRELLEMMDIAIVERLGVGNIITIKKP